MKWAVALLAPLLALCGARAAFAQDLSIVSVSSPDLGQIVSAASGNSIFTIPASGEAISKTGGAVRLSGGESGARVLVTLACGQQGACDNKSVTLVVFATGTSTGRARTLSRFSASTLGASAVLADASPPTPANLLFVRLDPIGRNMTKTLWLGYDFTLGGDDSSAPTGRASSPFVVAMVDEKGKFVGLTVASVTATVFRTMSIATQRDLSFGRIIRPSSGTGSARVGPGGGIVVSGAGVTAFPSPLPSSAAFLVGGEGGQAISLSIPSQFRMTNGGAAIDVTLLPGTSGATSLGGTIGQQGSRLVEVGGEMTLSAGQPLGNYSGQFQVLVQYN